MRAGLKLPEDRTGKVRRQDWKTKKAGLGLGNERSGKLNGCEPICGRALGW